jgi:hypothetical protein
MKIQNILRMQAIVVGLGATLFLASSTPAQEIVNTEFNNGPYVTTFDQPTSSAYTAEASTAGDSNTVTPAVAIATPVATNEAMLSAETSAIRWLVASSLSGIALLAVYAFAEIRRANRRFPQSTSSPLQQRAAVS